MVLFLLGPTVFTMFESLNKNEFELWCLKLEQMHLEKSAPTFEIDCCINDVLWYTDCVSVNKKNTIRFLSPGKRKYNLRSTFVWHWHAAQMLESGPSDCITSVKRPYLNFLVNEFELNGTKRLVKRDWPHYRAGYLRCYKSTGLVTQRSLVRIPLKPNFLCSLIHLNGTMFTL